MIIAATNGYANTTHIMHIIKNNTPFEFYYALAPTTEVPSAFSCNCSGLISPGEQKICDCYSELDVMQRKYRLEYMKNTSPTYRLTATQTAKSEEMITWTLLFDKYWQWFSVKSEKNSLDQQLESYQP